MKTKEIRASLMLTITALIWGIAFVAQSVGMDYVGPFTFNAVRYMIGGLVLIPCMFILKKVAPQTELRGMSAEQRVDRFHDGIKGGLCCGMFLFVATMLQQFGIMYTTVGKAGFITSLYIIIVPIFGLFLHKKVGLNVWISVGIALAGMYLLCIKTGFSISAGDVIIFLCAIGFSFHILVIDYWSPRADGVLISCVQFFTASVLGGVGMLLTETPSLSGILGAAVPILYTGVMSSGVAYTFQIIAQKDLNPTVATLLMSLESVFSLLAGWVILGQKMTGRELFGAALVFAAVLLAQLPVGELLSGKYRSIGKKAEMGDEPQ